VNRLLKSIILVSVSGLWLGSPTMAEAHNWPSKPLQVIVPIGPGGPTDIIARVVFEQLARQLGQRIIVENRPGAGGTLGAAFVAKAPPDGYTVLANGSGHVIAPALHHPSYEVARDFAAVVPFCTSSSVLVVPPSRGFRTAGDLVAAAKARPDGLNFASVGVGTFTHLSAERFLASAGSRAVHIPFRGGPAAMAEVMAGRIDFFFGPISLVISQVRDGKLTALAVNGTQRSGLLPDVPTLSEAGFANADYPVWFGMFLPANTPRPIIDKLYDETQKALRTTEVQDKLAALGCELMHMTTNEFGAYVRKEISLNAAVVKAIGLGLE
jgi:tripartite-type tricarboxylate transporter receptor subunit TctC